MRKLVIILDLSQLLITTAIIIGFDLSLSSTVFFLNLLAERGGIGSDMGKISFAILLLQDIAVIPLLTLISMLAGGEISIAESGLTLLYDLAVIASLLLIGKYALNPILDKIVASQDPEVFVAVAVLLVLSLAKLMELLGLSMALGALVADLMLAE